MKNFHYNENCIFKSKSLEVIKELLAQWIRRVPTEHEIPGSTPG